MDMAEYRGYIISENTTGYVRYNFYHECDEVISGNGNSIQDCEKQIDEILGDDTWEI